MNHGIRSTSKRHGKEKGHVWNIAPTRYSFWGGYITSLSFNPSIESPNKYNLKKLTHLSSRNNINLDELRAVKNDIHVETPWPSTLANKQRQMNFRSQPRLSMLPQITSLCRCGNSWGGWWKVGARVRNTLPETDSLHLKMDGQFLGASCQLLWVKWSIPKFPSQL